LRIARGVHPLIRGRFIHGRHQPLGCLWRQRADLVSQIMKTADFVEESI